MERVDIWIRSADNVDALGTCSWVAGQCFSFAVLRDKGLSSVLRGAILGERGGGL